MAEQTPIVGIDLGTTNSLVAFCDERGPRILHGGDGDSLVPSVVRYVPGEGGRLRAIVGREAAENAEEHPRTTISSVKRLMGRSLDDAAADLKFLGYRVVEGEHRQARVSVPVEGAGEREISPQEVSAEVLRALKRRASEAMGTEVSRAVVTVPAYFDDSQRQATRDAGRMAGLEVVRIVNEPTAAALAYGLGDEPGDDPRTVAVYDLGGGTFDVSILRITPAAGEGETAFFQVLATAGDTHLGGDDVDHMLLEMFAREIDEARREARAGADENVPAEAERIDFDLSSLDAKTRRTLARFARTVKHRLSEEHSAHVQIVLEDITYDRKVTRHELEEMMAPWVERTMRACERATRDASASAAGGIDAVILVGGSTRIPLVRQRVREHFGLEPYCAIDPDEVVALGASVQAAILQGTRRGALLLDVIPLSLGLETVGGAVAKLIMRNSTVPARASEMFSTSVDGQTQIKLNVVQGEREMVADCRSLGRFILHVPPMPAGIPQVEVEFLVDANGVLRVSASEKRSGRRSEIQVVPNHGLTREEVDRIERESVEHAREDMARHRIVDLVANGKLDIKWVGERLERHGADLEEGYRRELEGKLERLKGLVARAEADWQSVDANELHRAKQELDDASVRLQEVAIASTLRQGG